MKKFFAIVLTIAMLLTAVAACADGGPEMGGPQGGPQMGQMQGGPQTGNNNDRQTPPEKPSGAKPADAPEKPSGDQGTAPEKPDAAPEKPTGEKPADAPAEPEDLTGDKPTDMPEKPTDGQQAPADDQRPTGGQQAPQGQDGQGQGNKALKMIDFDAMVTKGIISQETRDAIKTYMDAHKPAGEAPQAPADGQAPAGFEAPAENSLLNDLLNAGIISQAEYDAMLAA